MTRINKYLARAGVGSRRVIEDYIADGGVKVDGKIVTRPEQQIIGNESFSVWGKRVKTPEPTRLLALHKPQGVLVTRTDPRNRPTVYDLLPENLHNMKPVGRLDYNSEGLLLLTNDGVFSRYLEHPESEIRRVYRVRAYGKADSRLQRLAKGYKLDDKKLKPIKVVPEHPVKVNYPINAWYRVSLYEGKYREVRRVFAKLGFTVSRLIRVAYGPYSLGYLPRCKWINLSIDRKQIKYTDNLDYNSKELIN